jgi:hypothetical protein
VIRRSRSFFQFFQALAASLRHDVNSFHCPVKPHPALCNKRTKGDFATPFGRICLNLSASLRYLPPPDRVNHEDANRRAAA